MALDVVPGIIEVPGHGICLESMHLGGQLAGQANANERQPETVARFARAGLRSTWPWQSSSTRRRKHAWTTNNADELLCLCRAVYSSRWDER